MADDDFRNLLCIAPSNTDKLPEEPEEDPSQIKLTMEQRVAIIKYAFTDDEKKEIIKTIFDGKMPDYLWYSGNEHHVPGEGYIHGHSSAIFSQTGVPDKFGNVEVHLSHIMPGSVLRIRDVYSCRSAVHVQPTLHLGEVTMRLYLAQTGSMEYDTRVNFADKIAQVSPSKRDFVEQYDLKYVQRKITQSELRRMN